MTVGVLLNRLDGVKQTGPYRWLARCPAHDDRHPSLSVRELPSGKVLVHCHSGCSFFDVIAAAGIDPVALIPESERIDHRQRGERRPFPAADVLRALDREVLIVATAASYLANGGVLTDEDRARLLLAAQRISQAVWESRHG